MHAVSIILTALLFLQDEALYQGKPASYWASELKKSKNRDELKVCTSAFESMGHKVGEVADALVGVWRLRDSDSRVTEDAIVSLGSIGKAAHAAKEDLERLIRDESPNVRDAARKALDRIR